MTVKVAINGFGRIGRNVFKLALDHSDIEIVAINDLTDAKTLAHLLKYDSVHGKFNGTIDTTDNAIVVNGKSIPIYAIRNPKELPWGELNVDVAVEATGIFAADRSDKGGYLDHIDAGAKQVVLTVPAKSKITTVVLGVNSEVITNDVNAYSNASCTTNCLAPIAKVLQDNFGIVKGYMTTYMLSQMISKFLIYLIKIYVVLVPQASLLFQQPQALRKRLDWLFLNWWVS